MSNFTRERSPGVGAAMRNDRGHHNFDVIHVRNENTQPPLLNRAHRLDTAREVGRVGRRALRRRGKRYDLNTVTGILNATQNAMAKQKTSQACNRRATMINKYRYEGFHQPPASTNRMLNHGPLLLYPNAPLRAGVGTTRCPVRDRFQPLGTCHCPPG